MNYKKIYDSLVEKAKVRGLDKSKHEGYFEIHHIIPRSVGGTDEQSNMVMFTGREHFVAHMLLYRIYEGDISLMRAAFLMSSRWSSGCLEESKPIHSKTYEKLRKEYSESVRIQMTENNPWKGKSHSEESIRKMLRSKAIYYRKESLKNWKRTNQKYFSQYKFEVKSKVQQFIIDIGDDIQKFNPKFDVSLWIKYEAIKDFWERSDKPGAKLLSTNIGKVSGEIIPRHLLKVMERKFKEDWDASSDPSFVCMALNNYKDHEESINLFIQNTSKTLKELEEGYIASWLDNREKNRLKIEEGTTKLGVEKHKNNSKAKLSVVDVVEAMILWKSGLVEQKTIAKMLGVARNSISNALEAEGRWLSARDAVPKIMEVYFEG